MLLAWRYWATGEEFSWRSKIGLGYGFFVLVLLHLFWGTVNTFGEQAQLASVVYLSGWLWGPGALEQFLLQDSLQQRLFGLALVLSLIVLKALSALLIVGLAWQIVTRDIVSWTLSWRLVRPLVVRLFLYLLVFEVMIYQIEQIYLHLSQYLNTHWFGVLYGSTWREAVIPEFVREISWMPLSFIITILWLAGVAEFFLSTSRDDELLRE